MKITSAILCLSVMLMLSLVAAGAQERDPFFPSGPRSTVTTTGSQEKAWGRDPFSRPFEGKAQIPKTSGAKEQRFLTGIIYGKDARFAIIGGETYKEGSRIGDRRLLDIRRRSVVLASESGIREEIFLEDFSMRK